MLPRLTVIKQLIFYILRALVGHEISMKTHVSVKSFLSWEFLFGKFCTPRKAFKANGVTLPRPINEVLFGLTLFLSHTHSKQVCSIHSMYVCTYLDQQHSRGKSQNVVLAKQQYVLRTSVSKKTGDQYKYVVQFLLIMAQIIPIFFHVSMLIYTRDSSPGKILMVQRFVL